MSKTNSHQVCITSRKTKVFLLIMLCSFFVPLVGLQAQEAYPSGDPGIVMGNSDSRLVASIEETEETVELRVLIVGEFAADAIEFCLFFNPDVLQLEDKVNWNDLSYSIGSAPELYNAASINRPMPQDWIISYFQQREAGYFEPGVSKFDRSQYSRRNNMRAVIVEAFGGAPVQGFQEHIGNVLSIYFKKQNQGQPLVHEDIGLGVNTNITCGLFSPKWSYGNTITYADDKGEHEPSLIKPELFLFRVPSQVYVNGEPEIDGCTATLYGGVKRSEHLTPTEEMIDNTGDETTGNARLEWDFIGQTGFIYTESDVEIFIDEYSYGRAIQLLDGSGSGSGSYNFPTAQEIEDNEGVFNFGGHIFHFVTTEITSENTAESEIPFDAKIENLSPDTEYRAWAFMQYNIETSMPYPKISDRFSFATAPFVVRGTVYPFVYSGDAAFDALFPITISAHKMPDANSFDPIWDIMDDQNPIEVTQATYYDGAQYIESAPKYPGSVCGMDQPGVPIYWHLLGKSQDPNTDSTLVSGPNDIPQADGNNAVGMYEFHNLQVGAEYILYIQRRGFISRFAKVEVTSDGLIEHRYLIPGDVDGALEVTVHDLSMQNAKTGFSYGDTGYEARCDLDANGDVDLNDNACMMSKLNMYMETYSDTDAWLRAAMGW